MRLNLTRRDALAAMAAGVVAPAFADSRTDPLVMIVMDPLCAELSCACVKGYAQRNYEKLAAALSKEIDRPVKVHYSGSLADALKKKTEGKADLIIGKESVVRIQGAAGKLTPKPIASLTGLDGKTTMTGLFVVAAADPAITPGDLKEHRILFGPPACDEKYKAAHVVLKDAGMKLPEKFESCGTCSEGAVTVVETAKSGSKICTVISSYAQPLLEGCGTVKKGDLRVVGETAEVPFIVAFVTDAVPPDQQAAIEKCLLNVGKDKALSAAMETKNGFVPISTEDGKKK